MAKVLAVIAARLNSSRLPGKQLLDLAGEPLIARIFQRLEQLPEIDEIVLATTADKYNQPLVEWANQSGKKVFSFNGDINDVVGRVDAVVQSSHAKIIVFCCGDSPLIEPTTLSKMILALQQNPEAEDVALSSGVAGKQSIHEGFYPYRRQTWERIVKASDTPEKREHVGLAKCQFASELRRCQVDDLALFSTLKHRISVDTISDYHFMAELYQRWYAEHERDSIVSLPWVIELLQQDSRLRAVNQHVQQREPSKHAPSVLVATQCGKDVGLGHLTRSCVVARQFQEQLAAGVTLLLQGDEVDYQPLALLPHHIIDWSVSFTDTLKHILESKQIDILIVDLPVIKDALVFCKILQSIPSNRTIKVAIDGLFEFVDKLDLIHVPSFYLAPNIVQKIDQNKIAYGWDCYLLPPVNDVVAWQPGRRLLVMTGGSDLHELGRYWPALLDQQLPLGMEVVWVNGPYAASPEIPFSPRLKWDVLDNPPDSGVVMASCDYALCLYGVGFFELLQHGIPTVVWSGNPAQQQEMKALEVQRVAIVAGSAEQAIECIDILIRDEALARKCHASATVAMSGKNGTALLVKRVHGLLEPRS